MFNATWVRNAVLLVISPLWFVAIYLVLILLLPIALWLHERLDSIVLVLLAGVAGAVDILRFRSRRWAGGCTDHWHSSAR